MSSETMPTGARKWTQWLTGAVIIALGVGVLWWLNRPTPEEATPADDAARIPETITLPPESLQLAELGIETLRPRDLTRVLRLFGQVEPMPENLVNLNSRVTGRVLEIRAHVGDRVRRGQVLAVLDSEEIHRAEVAYAQAKRQLAFARAELERRKRLAQLGAYSNPALEEARTRLASARAELRAAEAEHRNAQNAVQAAQSQLAKANTALQQANAQLARAERLLQAQLIAQQEYEAIRAHAQQAQADVEIAQAQLQSARAALQSARISRF
jgi:multidrug efflux pump subunit AcrA (membrane-fusion protein)